MATVDPGLLDREITLQLATKSTDATSGQDVLTWDDEETIWAQWLPSGTREFWQARQIRADISGVYKTYYREDILPDVVRIVGHDLRTFDVTGVTEIGRREGLLVSVLARAEAP